MWELGPLPVGIDLETKKVLKKLPSVHRALAELKGIASTMPNQNILLNTLAIQEAKDSSEVENIVTTHDELYKASLELENIQTLAAKEVQNYISGLKRGFTLVKEYGFLNSNHIIQIQSLLENSEAGFRKVPGTTLKNEKTGQIIYTPPQDHSSIVSLMTNLEKFINNNEISELDSLIKMAVIHFQFESIHPFYDGNGRTGRIINIMYLVLQNLLQAPTLYLSRYINQNKTKYYEYIQLVRDSNDWEPFILYMLDAVEQTSSQTVELILQIKVLMQDYKIKIRDRYKFYSQDLLNNLFKHPYTKINFLEQELRISRPTATNYANRLVEDGFLVKQKLGNTYYFINQPLVNLLMNLQPLESKV